MTGVTEERRWPGLAGEAAGPGHKPHGNPASHSAAERVVTSVKAVIRLLGTNLPQKSRGGGENLTSAILGKTLQGGNGGQGRTSLLWEAGSSALCTFSPRYPVPVGPDPPSTPQFSPAEHPSPQLRAGACPTAGRARRWAPCPLRAAAGAHFPAALR